MAMDSSAENSMYINEVWVQCEARKLFEMETVIKRG